MKILYVMQSDDVGGGNRIIYEHCNRLKERGHTVHIYQTHGSTNNRWFDIKVPIFTSPLRVHKDYDVVVLTYFNTYYMSKMVGQLRNIPKAYLVQGRESYFIKEQWWYDRVSRTYNDESLYLITISKQLKDWLKEEYGRDSHYVPNGIDMEHFKPKHTGLLDKPRPVVLLEGSFKFWLKGVCDAIHGCIKCREKYGKDFDIWLMTSEDTKEIPQVDRIFYKPPQEHIPEIYSTADVVLKASYMEGSPLPHMEAMACGSCLVTSDCVGTEEYCKHLKNCYKFKVGDIDEMALNIARALDNPILGMDFANKNFDWEAKIDELEVALQNAAGRKVTKTD